MSAFIFDQSLLRIIKLTIHLHQSHNQGHCTTQHLTNCFHMFQLYANALVTFNDRPDHPVICPDHFYLGLFFSYYFAIISLQNSSGDIVGSYEIPIPFRFLNLPYFLVLWIPG